MIEFTLTAYTLDNTEVFMMLAPRIIEVATASNGDQYGQAAGLVSHYQSSEHEQPWLHLASTNQLSYCLNMKFVCGDQLFFNHARCCHLSEQPPHHN